jgi:prepilin-type N-terminal cleavage/methylation domain-containing protein
MTRAVAHMRHGEDGFTLVELLVAMTLSVVVLLATLTTFDGFSRNAARQTRVADAGDQVRRVMDRTVGDLRGASVVLRASASDLVYVVPVATGSRVQRLCVDSGELYSSVTVTASTPAAPAAACSTGAKVASLKSTASTAFTYDGAASAATPALVKNVGITLSLDASKAGKTGSSTLKASAARRSAISLPITDRDLDATCNSGGALLSLGVSLPDYGPLTVTYADTGGVSLGTPSGNTLQVPESVTNVVATVTNAAGITKTISKDVKCGT